MYLEVKLYTAAGEKITYDIEDDYYDDNDATGGVIDTLLGKAAIGAGAVVNIGHLIEVRLNAAGEIDDIDPVVTTKVLKDTAIMLVAWAILKVMMYQSFQWSLEVFSRQHSDI